MRPRMSGAVRRLPFETRGFAPQIIRCEVLSTSGIGIDDQWPNMCPAEKCFGIWSTEDAE